MNPTYDQGGLNKKEIQLNVVTRLQFNKLYLLAFISLYLVEN